MKQLTIASPPHKCSKCQENLHQLGMPLVFDEGITTLLESYFQQNPGEEEALRRRRRGEEYVEIRNEDFEHHYQEAIHPDPAAGHAYS